VAVSFSDVTENKRLQADLIQRAVDLQRAARAGSGAGTGACSGARALGRARRVLIVDDNADACASLVQILALEGFDVRACEDGAQALAAARDLTPEVAFIDLNMPRMTGVELAEKLRAEPWGRAIRLVALTGMGRQGDPKRRVWPGFMPTSQSPRRPNRCCASPRHRWTT